MEAVTKKQTKAEPERRAPQGHQVNDEDNDAISNVSRSRRKERKWNAIEGKCACEANETKHKRHGSSIS